VACRSRPAGRGARIHWSVVRRPSFSCRLHALYSLPRSTRPLCVLLMQSMCTQSDCCLRQHGIPAVSACDVSKIDVDGQLHCRGMSSAMMTALRACDMASGCRGTARIWVPRLENPEGGQRHAWPCTRMDWIGFVLDCPSLHAACRLGNGQARLPYTQRTVLNAILTVRKERGVVGCGCRVAR
jgi:hypothetical protein